MAKCYSGFLHKWISAQEDFWTTTNLEKLANLADTKVKRELLGVLIHFPL